MGRLGSRGLGIGIGRIRWRRRGLGSRIIKNWGQMGGCSIGRIGKFIRWWRLVWIWMGIWWFRIGRRRRIAKLRRGLKGSKRLTKYVCLIIKIRYSKHEKLRELKRNHFRKNCWFNLKGILIILKLFFLQYF
jgi:hypothetical protein